MPSPTNRARALWQSCLAAAFRTALACAIVGCTTLYGPTTLRCHIAFPAFSYATVILIVTDATLGDTLRGCWHALYATVQGVCPATLCLWAIGPARFTTTTTAVAVALSAFVVVLPAEKTHLVSKRIALGQIVIVYVIGFINGVHTEVVMHPAHVAASTAIGALACVLALLLPCPNLACYEVKQNCKLFVDNASQRLKLFVKAFCAEDNTSTLALISQAKSLAITGTTLLQSIKCKQESMQWESVPIKILKPYCMNPGERLQDLDTPLRGMDIALSNSHSFPVRMLQPELKDGLLSLEGHINLYLNQVCMPFDLATVPESNAENLMKSLHTLQKIPPIHENAPSFFFLFCLKLLHTKLMALSSTNSPPKSSTDSHKRDRCFFKGISNKRFMPALKCSLSLGLAVLFGLTYSKENGYWSGLPVAISLASTREATFKVANVKAQGTVLGTVYGVLGCFVLEKFVQIRFISLLPWFVFTSFLRRSRMYGQPGGISAVIGAVIILGRQNFGPPSEFAIARITETFIGLSCSIVVDILLQPTRASTLAKIQLSKSLLSLHECIAAVSLGSSKASLEESQKKLKVHVSELKKFIEEAEVEPNFWFLPFHSACYTKLLGSLSKMVDFLLFETHAIGFLEQESQSINPTVWKEAVNKLDGELKLFKEMVGSSIKCVEEVTLVKSLTALEKELQKNNISYDIELGKPPIPNLFRSSDSDVDEREKIIGSFLQNLKQVVDKIYAGEGEEEVKSQLILGLGALAFCLSSLVSETREIEKGIKELIQWENPSSNVNLCEIYCKIHALYK